MYVHVKSIFQNLAWKGFRRAAPRRVRNLTREWFEYGLHYSGAGQPADEQGLLPSQVAKFCADTPTPEELDKLNKTLNKQIAYTEQAQELGLDEEFGETLGEGVDEGLMQEVDKDMADLWAQEWVDNEEWEHNWDDNEGVEGGEREEDDAGPAAEEPVQYYNNGRISAQSKGKGRATH